MAVKRSITPKNIVSKELVAQPAARVKSKVSAETPEREVRTKKICHWCKNKTNPAYFDIVSLRKNINDRGRIASRTRSGACSKHQRQVAREIKRARHLSLLPFTIKA